MGVARFLNWVPTLAELGYPVPWQPELFLEVIAARKARGEVWLGPAYKVGTGGKAGDKAKAELFELHHLSVGMEVPDLQGEDLDGKTFKLSDYRGKVVFLDFWAHW